MRSSPGIQFLLAIAITLAATSIQAQNAQSQQSTDDPNVTWANSLKGLIDIDQPSGTVSQYIATIRDNNPQLNIVVTDSASGYPLPEIKLVDVQVRGSLSLLSTLTNNEVQVDFMSEEEGREANLVMIAGGRGENLDGALTVRVLNVKQLLQASNREAMLSALDEGYRLLDNQSTAVEIKIHEATGLLFVKGTPAQLMLAEAVVHEIEVGVLGSPSGNPFGQSSNPPTLHNDPSGRSSNVPTLSETPSSTIPPKK